MREHGVVSDTATERETDINRPTNTLTFEHLNSNGRNSICRAESICCGPHYLSKSPRAQGFTCGNTHTGLIQHMQIYTKHNNNHAS